MIIISIVENVLSGFKIKKLKIIDISLRRIIFGAIFSHFNW